MYVTELQNVTDERGKGVKKLGTLQTSFKNCPYCITAFFTLPSRFF